MNVILAAVALLIQFLPQVLSSAGVITPSMSGLLTKLGSIVPGLITDLSSGKGPSADALDVLQAFQTEMVTLQADSSLDPAALALSLTLSGAIAAALTAYKQAALVTDPSTLTLLPTDLTSESGVK